jgi:ATP-dependent Clp protease ATP-binding subunit ClpB
VSVDPSRLTIRARQAVAEAQRQAGRRSHQQVEPEHLLAALLADPEGVIYPLLHRLGTSPAFLRDRLEERLERVPKVYGPSPEVALSRQTGQVLERAFSEAGTMGDEYVSTEHLLLAMLEGDTEVGRLLADAGLAREPVLSALAEVRGRQRVTDESPEEKYQALERYGRDLTDLARRGKLDPVIGRDDEIRRVIQVLSRRTKNNPVLIGEPGVGKTAIAEGLARRIVEGDVPEGLKGKRIVALDIGSLVAGTKYRGEFEERFRAVLREIAASEGQIVTFIDELHTVVGAGAAEGAVDAGNMLKPMLARGELRAIGATTLDEYRSRIEKDPALERRFQPVLIGEPSVGDTIGILRGLKERYEVHHGVRITDEALVAAAMLSDRYVTGRFLPDKAIDLVDEAASRLRIEIDSMPTEIDEVDRRVRQLEIERAALKKERDEVSRERLGSLERELADLNEQLQSMRGHWEREKERIDRIRALKADMEAAHRELELAQRDTGPNALDRAAEIQHGRLPELQRQLDEENARLAELQADRKMLKEEVDQEDVAEVVSKWTGIPVSRLMEGEVAKLVRMEEALHQRVVGQDQAVAAVANAIRRARAGLSDPNRPIGSFLFLGPTGVGKTELARALAEFLFDDERAMARIDMSEYQERHAVSRLVGAPPGYVGYEEGGQLTEAIRRRPYSVILLDEIEKAHQDAFNLLLQVLEDGRLTDGQGRTVDFKNTVLIMTSNLGSNWFFEEWLSPDERRDRVLGEVRQAFRPEFLNRLDETIVFRPLDKEEIAAIVDIQVRLLRERLAARRLQIELTDGARAYLSEKGYDPSFGARPLKRLIQKEVQDPLAKMLLAGEVVEGARVVVERGDEGLDFRVAEQATAS